jgi:F-type H+-transporting ATPase subunit a
MVMVKTDPMHQFQIHPLFPGMEWNVGGFNLAPTNSALFLMIAVVLVIGVLAIGTASLKTIPNRWQSLTEIWYGFIDGIVKDVNHGHATSFVPLVFTVFSLIFAANMLGMFPYFFTATSHIAVTGVMAVATILLVIVVGLAKKGIGFFKIFVPSGVPLILLFIVTPIEIISFLSRPISLGMRLFANMLGGHVALKVFAGFIPSLAGALGGVGMLMGGLLVMPLVVGVTALEFLVAFLQAYVFAMLTCVYLNDAVGEAH